jgi:nucleotide-binding universal stress UspA family protein
MDQPARVVPDGPLLIGVDETERSRDAIALGQQLAPCVPGQPMYVYVHTLEELDALMAGWRPEEVEQLVAEHAQDKLARVRALAAEMGVSDVQLRQAASAAEGLHEQAVEREAALVAIGSSSRSGLGRVLPGGTAERLLSGAPVPVAVAPSGYAGREPGRLVIGVGFDRSPEAQQAVRWAADLATRSGASVQVLAVHTPMAFGSAVAGGTYGTLTVNQALANELRSESEQLSEGLPADLSVDPHVLEGDPAKLLVERSQELGLLVLGSRRYGPVKSVLLGSVSSYVSRNSYCPVLVVPRGAGGQQAG